jgi:hypothetical protein
MHFFDLQRLAGAAGDWFVTEPWTSNALWKPLIRLLAHDSHDE